MIWKGVPLGFLKDRTPLFYDGPITFVVGPPGALKTAGVLIPYLLDEPGKRSIIVVGDAKGEITATTINYRRKVCGEESVFVGNPEGVLTNIRPDMKSDGWNPLGHLNPDDPTFDDDCAAVGYAMIKSEAGANDRYFSDAARSVGTGFVRFEVFDALANDQPPSIANVRKLSTQDPKGLKRAIQAMISMGDFEITSRVSKLLADNTETSGIRNTVEVQTAWQTGAMRDDMATASGIDFRKCRERPTTIYMILPTESLQSKSSYLRMVLSTALRSLYKPGGVRTTLIIEEAFVMGHHAEIEQAAAILRGYGHQIVIVFQSISQAKQIYPQTWGMFMSGATLAYRPADMETAELLSKRCGKRYVAVRSMHDPKMNEPQALGGVNQQERDRIPLGDMFDMPQGCALAWVPGRGVPYIVRVKGYFEIPELNGRADPNPYYANPKAAPAASGWARAVGLGVGFVILAGSVLYFFA